MNPVQQKTCVQCGNPYGTLPPIDAPVEIVTPEGKRLVPGTLSEKAMSPPQPPAMATGMLDLLTAKSPDETVVEEKPWSPTPVLKAPLEGMKNKMDIIEPWKHEIIGGKVTICILMYGDYAELHKHCLNAILTTTLQIARDIRIACNAVCPATLEYLSKLTSEGALQKVFVNPTNIKKGPAMRQLFYDPVNPIETKWVIWFDDDSIANKDGAWLQKLLSTIIMYAPRKALYGAEYSWEFHKAQIEWIKSRPWYHGRQFQTVRGHEAPNAHKVVFAAGGFWAASMDAIRQAGVPDPEIGHNGTDYMLAEQLWQSGYGLKGWNNKKQFVRTSSVERRGLVEEHTGMPNWAPGGVAKHTKS